MSARILVTGAPGNVGTPVVHELRELGASSFRVAARHPDAARQHLGDDLEIVPFDFLKPETFKVFEGVERVFLVRPPALANVERDIAPALRAAQRAGVQQIVFLSLQGVENNRVVPHHKIEVLIQELGLSYTFLRAGFFMQNLSTTHRDEIAQRDEIAVPVGDARTSFIDTRDIAAVAARVLTEEGHEHQAYVLTGAEALTYDEVAATLSRVLGRNIRYTRPSVWRFFQQQLAKGQKLGFAFVVTMLYTITRFGNAATVSEDVQRVLQRPPRSLETFVRDHQACWQRA